MTKISAEDAVKFDQVSPMHIAMIAKAIGERATAGKHKNCSCQAYQDVFTFNRWIALGRVVSKGEKAIAKLAGPRKITDKDGKEREIFWRTSVFCRCQTKTLADKEPAAEVTDDELTPAPMPNCTRFASLVVE